MITSLTIRNFALIEQLRIEFTPGLTVMTGETGAGKSIVVDALGLALGERADSAMVRDGAAKAVIEAELDASQLAFMRAVLDAAEIEWADPLILRREVASKGASRCFVNDTPVQVSLLKDIGDRLVDIHGQHEHQALLRAETHTATLDVFGEHEQLLSSYREHHAALLAAADEYARAVENRDRVEERRAVLDHQLLEITVVNPSPGEDEEIERELNIAEHAERIASLGHELLDSLFDADVNATDLIAHARRNVADLAGIDPVLSSLENELAAAAASVEETVRTVREYTEKVDFSPERCEMLRSRLASIAALKRKFRCTLAELLERKDTMRKERDSLENIDDTIRGLERVLEQRRAAASAHATVLTAAREKAAKSLGREVPRALKDLGIPHAVFETRFNRKPVEDGPVYLTIGGKRVAARDDGGESAEFFLSANIGEEPRPLVKVASGGEVSRIMLAMKSISAGRNAVPVMVFDEIDTGVSGAIAHKVGRTMRALATSQQILAITHLPQIAACGDAHLVVVKHSDASRTTTSVRQLVRDERTAEIARLISGDHVTDAALRNARELLSDNTTR